MHLELHAGECSHIGTSCILHAEHKIKNMHLYLKFEGMKVNYE